MKKNLHKANLFRSLDLVHSKRLVLLVFVETKFNNGLESNKTIVSENHFCRH